MTQNSHTLLVEVELGKTTLFRKETINQNSSGFISYISERLISRIHKEQQQQQKNPQTNFFVLNGGDVHL